MSRTGDVYILFALAVSNIAGCLAYLYGAKRFAASVRSSFYAPQLQFLRGGAQTTEAGCVVDEDSNRETKSRGHFDDTCTGECTLLCSCIRGTSILKHYRIT